MKKYGIVLSAALLLVGTGCAQNQADDTSVSYTAKPTVVEEEVVTAPKELDLAIIMENVKTNFSTVQEVKVFNEANDPYNNLGKTGYYTAGAAFWDTRTEYSEEYISDDEKGKWGASAGGSIEVYPSNEEAKKRIDYMQGFVGNALLEPGAFKQLDNIVIRASSKLAKSQQDEIMVYLEAQVQNY